MDSDRCNTPENAREAQTRSFHLTEQTRDKRPMEEVKRGLLLPC